MNKLIKFVFSPIPFSILLVVPSLIWVLLDNGITVGDQALYKLVSVELFNTLICDTSNWVQQCFEVMSSKAPLLWWAGQFFVPIGMSIGSVSKGLLLFPVAVEFAILFVSFKVFQNLFHSRQLAVLGVLIIASSRLLAILSTQFWTEPNRLLVVLLVIYVIINEHKYDSIKLFLILGTIFMLSILEKTTGPIFAFVPFCYGAFCIVRKLRSNNQGFHSKHLPFAILFLICTLITFKWYDQNLQYVLDWIHHATTSQNYHKQYGLSAWDRIFNWITNISYLLLSPIIVISAIGTLFFGLYKKSFFVKIENKFIVFISIFQIAIILLLFSRTSNPEVRYMLPLLPYFSIIILTLVKLVDSIKLTYVYIGLAFFQFTLTQSTAFGITSLPSSSPYFYRALQTEPSTDLKFKGILNSDGTSAVYFAVHSDLNSKIVKLFVLDNQKKPCTYFNMPEIYDVENEIDMMNYDGILDHEADSLVQRIYRDLPAYYVMHKDRTSVLEDTKESIGWHGILVKTELVNNAIESSELFELVPEFSDSNFSVYRSQSN